MLFDAIAGLSLLINPVPAEDLKAFHAGLQKTPPPVRIEVSLPSTTLDESRVPLVIQVDAQHADQVLARLLAQQPTSRPELDLVLERLEKLEKQLESLQGKLAFLPDVAPKQDAPDFSTGESCIANAGIFIGETGPRAILPDWQARFLLGSNEQMSLWDGDSSRYGRRQAVEKMLQTLMELNHPRPVPPVPLRGFVDVD